MQVKYNDDGLTALIFTAEGDMRQAINNLQSTHSGFGFVSADNVFKVCDQPHPITVQAIIRACTKGDIDLAMEKLNEEANTFMDVLEDAFALAERGITNRDKNPMFWNLRDAFIQKDIKTLLL